MSITDLHKLLRSAQVEFSGSNLSGIDVQRQTRTLGQMKGFFADSHAYDSMSPDTELYHIDIFAPVDGGTEGGLFFGITHILPGVVGDEYFMTKGHFHQKANRAEYYWGISGNGFLVMKSDNVWVEMVCPGSLHYIPGHTAHRLVNCGDSLLNVGACWPADAGHEYGSIEQEGFGLCVMKGSDGPVFVKS